MSYFTVEDTFSYLNQIPSGNLMEWGVFSGNTLNRLIKGAEAAQKPFTAVYGFDSWIGLPKEAAGVWQNPEWPETAFSVCRDFNLATPEEAVEFVRNRVERKDINLISGFFSDTLTDELGEKLKDSASYIHIDTDIYLSSYQCLNWILKHKIAKPGCFFRFDDWNSTPYGEGGQSLAYIQCLQKYKFAHTRNNNVMVLHSY